MRRRFSSSLQALACLALLLAAAPARAQTFAGRKLAGCFGGSLYHFNLFPCQFLSSTFGVREARTHEAVDGPSLLLCCSVRRQGPRQAVCESQPLLQQMGEGGAGRSPGHGMPALLRHCSDIRCRSCKVDWVSPTAHAAGRLWHDQRLLWDRQLCQRALQKGTRGCIPFPLSLSIPHSTALARGLSATLSQAAHCSRHEQRGGAFPSIPC